jgi:hypothetical protein
MVYKAPHPVPEVEDSQKIFTSEYHVLLIDAVLTNFWVNQELVALQPVALLKAAVLKSAANHVEEVEEGVAVECKSVAVLKFVGPPNVALEKVAGIRDVLKVRNLSNNLSRTITIIRSLQPLIAHQDLSTKMGVTTLR